MDFAIIAYFDAGGCFMKDYVASNIRNIAILGHGSEGKTTLTEAMLFATGTIDRQGRVEDGSTVTDFDQEENKRKISISAAVAPFEWMDIKINAIDVPGYFDFIGEMMGPLSAAENAMILVGSTSGISVGAEKAWDQCAKYGVSRIFVVNQMDRENANYDKIVSLLTEKYGSSIVAMQLPIMVGNVFKGFVDILSGKAYEGAGKTFKEIPVPANLQSDMESAFEAMVEAAAGTNEELMMEFFDKGELTMEQTVTGIRAGIIEGTFVPVFMTSATTGVGVMKLIESIVRLLPSPQGVVSTCKSLRSGEETKRVCDVDQPFSAQVFKTLADPFVGKLSIFKVKSGSLSVDTQLYNSNVEKAEKINTIYTLRGKKQTTVTKLIAGDIGALAKLQFTATGHTLCDAAKPVLYSEISFPEPCISMAVYAKKEGDEDKVFSGLYRLMEEDPTIRIEKSAFTTETILSGLGELHIDVTSRKLAAKFGAEALMQDPKIPYRESIRKSIRVQGRHKKQSGGHGQFGDVWIEFEPIVGESTDFEFVDKVVGGSVPRNFIPAVEKGLRENLGKGVVAGYPMVKLRASLVDGSYHAVDSSEMAFKIAARNAFKKLIDANPALLEPIYHVEVYVPDEYMGDIIGDMNRRRGRVLGMNQVDSLQQIITEVPLTEMFKYATDLRSMTQARGSFSMSFERYEEMPAMEAKKIIDSHKKEEEDDDK